MPNADIPVPPERLRTRRWALIRFLGKAYLRCFGWRFEGRFPDEVRHVTIVAPHTSNWDFFLGIAVLFATDLKLHWLGKHTIFRWPVKGLLTRLGGIPVNRSAAHGVVGESTAIFEGRDAMMLALAPEGTRKGPSRWRSGFHAIATGAKVPIFPVAFDYVPKLIRLMPVFHPTGDFGVDLPAIQALFKDVQGKRARPATA